MNKIIEYRVATGVGDYKELEREVNALIAKGFQPFGSIALTVEESGYYAQAMVKYENFTVGAMVG